MTLQEMVREKNMTRYQLSQRSGIPWATLSDIWTGKTRLERCSGGTLVKLSGTLGITVEELIALDVETSMPPDDSKAEKPYFEVNLPQDLEKARREYIQGEQGHSRSLDCLWGEKSSTLPEEILRAGCYVVSREVVVKVENHHLIIICLKL